MEAGGEDFAKGKDAPVNNGVTIGDDEMDIDTDQGARKTAVVENKGVDAGVQKEDAAPGTEVIAVGNDAMDIDTEKYRTARDASLKPEVFTNTGTSIGKSINSYSFASTQ